MLSVLKMKDILCLLILMIVFSTLQIIFLKQGRNTLKNYTKFISEEKVKLFYDPKF